VLNERLAGRVETKWEVNRAINEIRFLLKKWVKHRVNTGRMAREKEEKKEDPSA
jgi:hypothetical protein